MKLIYAQGFSKNEKMEWKPVVFTNIIQSFRAIYDAMNEMGIKFENPENEASLRLDAPLQQCWVLTEAVPCRKTWPKFLSTMR